MALETKITTLFLDVGGVLATNGWDHAGRKKVIESFGLDYPVVEARHASLFETYELGKITLDEYLDWVVFFQPRSFSKEDFKKQMYAQSVANQQMMEFFRKVRDAYHLKIVLVSNEGRELAEYRSEKFQLPKLADTLIFSSFVCSRKPDLQIYRLALDISQAHPEHVYYVDDRSLFVEVAKSLGIRGLQHQDYQKTLEAFTAEGLAPRNELFQSAH